MKKILTAVLLLTCFASFGQTIDLSKMGPASSGYGYSYKRVQIDSNLLIPKIKDTTNKIVGQIKLIDTSFGYTGTDGIWRLINPASYIQKQTQNPTATLTGGATVELMSSGADLPYTLNWSAGRVAGTSASLPTANITAINVAGTNETFSNPAAGATVSGTQAVTVTRNLNTAFQITVTTADSKTATANTSVIFQPKRYWFYSTSATPTSSDVVAALGGGSELSTSNTKSSFTITPSGGNQYLSYAYPSNEGALSSINIGSFESVLSFTQRTVSVTNASGYVQNYFVYTSNNQLPTTTINSAQ